MCDEPSIIDVPTTPHIHTTLKVHEVKLHHWKTPHNCSFVKPKKSANLDECGFK
jgi:hypothetical protein